MVDINLSAFTEGVETDKGLYSFVDSDTMRGPDAHDVRIRGVAGPEVAHVVKDEGIFSDDYLVTGGEYKGQFMADEVRKLAKEGGYTNLQLTGETDDHDRDIGDLVNEQGESFADRLLYEGILTPYDEKGTRLQEIGAFSRALRDDDTDDIWSQSRARAAAYDKQSAVGWKDIALNEQALGDYYTNTQDGTWGRYVTDEVAFTHSGMDMFGQADNAFATGMESGLNNIQASAYGAISAIGDMFDSKGIYQYGKAQATASEYENQQLGRFVNTIGDVESVTDFGRYAAGMTGQMIPYLAALFGSGVVGSAAAAATGVGALGVTIGVGLPSLIYAGEIYNGMEGGMEDKNVAIALAGGTIAGTLDRLGLKAVMKPSDFLMGDVNKQLIEQYAKKHNISFEAAQKRLRATAHRRAINEYAEMTGLSFDEAAKVVSKEFANTQRELLLAIGGTATLTLNKRLLVKEGLMRTGKGATVESATEVGQESAIYASQVAGSHKEWDTAEYGNIVANAATGGFIIGGGISGVTGTTSSYGKFKQAQRDFGVSSGGFNQDFYSGTTESNLIGLEAKANRDFQSQTDKDKDAVNNLIDNEYEEGRLLDTVREKGIVQAAKELPGRFARKFGGIVQDKFDKISPEAKFTLYTLMDNFMPSNTSHMEGINFGKMKRFLTSSLQREVGNIEAHLLGRLGLKVNKKNKQRASDMLVEYQRILEASKDGKPEIPPHLKESWEALAEASERMNSATDALLEIVRKQSGEDVGRQENYFSKSVKLDPMKIRKNREEFLHMARVHLGYSQANAEEFYDVLVNGPGGYDPARLAELGFKNRKQPGNLKQARAKLSQYKDIDKFTYDNKFDQMAGIIEQDINYAIDKKYLGTKGEKLNNVLALLKQQMGDEWDPRIATWIKDQIAAERGDYKPIKNKILREMQAWISWYNATTQLHTSMFSSIPELATIMLGKHAVPNQELILTATNGVAKKMLHDFARIKAKYIKNSGYDEQELNLAVEDFYRMGYAHGKEGAIAHFDVELGSGTSRKFREKTMEAFFKINMLGPFTDATRVARLAIANDAIFSDLEIVAQFYNEDGTVSNFAGDAWARLRDLNVNPSVMAAQYQKLVNDMKMDPNVDKMDSNSIHKYIIKNNPDLYKRLDMARKSYVDNALANPNPADRPLWYSNPHFRLFTQYNGFLSTFTAHILPRIWKNVKEGNPAARYNAVAAAVGMLALGFLGQDLKDEVDRQGKPPRSLSDLGYYQRGIAASGLLGTTERFVNLVHPLYGGQYRGAGDIVMGEMGPFTGSVQNILGTAERLAEGRDADIQKILPAGKLAKSYESLTNKLIGE